MLTSSFLLFLLWRQVQSWSSPIESLYSDRSRRTFVSTLIAAPIVVGSRDTLAELYNESANQGLVSPDRVASLLRAVPTFTIVDPKGVPFVVVGEDAKVTGYFFTTFAEADRILRLAKASADIAIKQSTADAKDSKFAADDVGLNPWSNARVSSVPLDFAVTMASKSAPGLYFKVAPAEEDVEEALGLIGKTEIAEGKVPLFYFEDFVISNRQGINQRPLFFRKSQLLKAWKEETNGAQVPKVQVTELFRVLKKMVEANGTDWDLREVVFVPPEESLRKAKDCNRRGKGESFQLGERIVVL